MDGGRLCGAARPPPATRALKLTRAPISEMNASHTHSVSLRHILKRNRHLRGVKYRQNAVGWSAGVRGYEGARGGLSCRQARATPNARSSEKPLPGKALSLTTICSHTWRQSPLRARRSPAACYVMGRGAFLVVLGPLANGEATTDRLDAVAARADACGQAPLNAAARRPAGRSGPRFRGLVSRCVGKVFVAVPAAGQQRRVRGWAHGGSLGVVLGNRSLRAPTHGPHAPPTVCSRFFWP